MGIFNTGSQGVVDPATGKSLAFDYMDNGRPVFPVHQEHAHWKYFNTHLHSTAGQPSTTLASSASAGDIELTLTDATGITSGKIFIDGASAREMDSIKVLSELNDVIQIAKPLQNDYPAGTTIQKVSLNLAKNGSMSSPVIFEMTAPPNAPVHIETVTWYIETPDRPFDKLFGGGPALANGLYMRSVHNNGTEYIDRGIFRINQRYRVFGYDVEELSFATGPQADWALWAKKNTLDEESGIIRLNPATNDAVQVLVQDDLTNTDNYTEVECVVSGHYEL